MNRRVMKMAVVALVALTCNLYGQQGRERAPQNLKVFPKDMPRRELLGMMNRMSSALGVRCVHCHVIGAFEKDDKPEKEIARGMLRMVNNLKQNADQFLPGGRVEKVTCWTCHRGSAKIELPPPPAEQGRPAGEQKPPRQEETTH